ncbi:type IV secretion system protein VirB10 [Pseudomonas sp. LB3P58]
MNNQINQPNAPDEQLNSLNGERGMPSVNEHGPSTMGRGVIVLALLLLAAVGGGLVYWKWNKNKAEDAAPVQRDIMGSSVPARTFVAPPAPSAPVAPVLPGQTQPTVPAPNGPYVAEGQRPALPGGGRGNGSANDKPPQVLDKAGSDLMVDRSGSKSRGTGAASPVTRGNENAGTNGGGSEEGGKGSLGSMLTATSTPGSSASMLGDRNFLIAKGAFIDCALKTRLDSTVAGMTACTVTRDIYSDNGHLLLVERGSEVTGEYKANMRQGMARIFVLWDRIKTPNGVVINLGSPGTDPLGGAGLPGYVDNHFWQRFGGAFALSLVDDVARGLTQSTSGSGDSQFNFNSTGDASQNMATEALKNTINIPPTLYKNQGEQVGIYIARDLDFSGVYDVTAE